MRAAPSVDWTGYAIAVTRHGSTRVPTQEGAVWWDRSTNLADEPIIIVVDALDEADEAERGDLLRSLEKILQESQNVVKIFVSSRNDGDIVDALEHYSNINIEEGMNGEDIRKFAEYKVQEAIETKRLLRGRVSLSLRKEITEPLLIGAQGM